MHEIINTTSLESPHSAVSLGGMGLFGLIFLGLLVFLTAFGNILVILAISRTTRLRTSSNLLIINMACGDVLYSISTLPLSMVLLCFRKSWPLGKMGNIIFDAIWFSFVVLSFLNVVVITLERYIAITKPFIYKRLVTKKRVVCICLGLWMYVAILIFAITFTFRIPKGDTYVFLIPGRSYYTVLISHAFLAFIFVPFLYVKIFFVAREHKVKIIKQQDAQTRRRFYLQMKATWTIGFVILLFYLVWLPYLIKQLADFKDINVGQWDAFNSITCYLTYCNGPVNILVYSCRNQEIRSSILKLLSLRRFSMNGSRSTSRQNVTLYPALGLISGGS